MSRKLAIIAVGGNALIRDSNRTTIADQHAAARETMRFVAQIVVDGWDVLITHGNGPQIGPVLQPAEPARHELQSIPLDASGAYTAGWMGYMIQKALSNELKARGSPKQAVTLITQSVVLQDDPAFGHPTKPIGFLMDQATARRCTALGWHVVEEVGRGWRRIVPSPRPVRIVEADAIRALLDGGFIVVAAGGGGIPVIENEVGELEGVEAVIDKDHASSLLAVEFGADLFLIPTAVERVAINFGTPSQRWMDRMTATEARRLLEDGQFAPGSMGPKIEAVLGFIERTNGQALITTPECISRALRHETGTWIVP